MKEKILHTLSYGLSVLLYPLFVPSYLMAAFSVLFSRLMLPLTFSYWTVLLGGTLFFTCLVPLLFLVLLIRLGYVKNLDVNNPKERTIPFLLSIVSMALWACFLRKIAMPAFCVYTAFAATFALLLVMLINLKWKISIHCTTMGAAIGFVAGFLLFFKISSPITISLLLLLALALMYARIYLNAHTPEQTVAGFLLGLAATITPNLLLLL